MAYKHKGWIIEYKGGPVSDSTIEAHDTRVGSYIRQYASAEYMIKRIMSLIMEIEFSDLFVLTSKYSATQTVMLFRDMLPSIPDETNRKDLQDAIKIFQSNVDFRNSLAHDLHTFRPEAVVMRKGSSKTNKLHGTEVILTDAEFDKKIATIKKMTEQLIQSYIKLNEELGDPHDVNVLGELSSS